MNWKDILKEDFSFRDVVKNSRGVYAGIFDRIQDTPSLSKLGGAVLGDALKELEDIEGLTVTDKRKAAEVVLMEPILIGIDMMNDPSMEKNINNLRESRITNIKQDDDENDKNEEVDLTDEQIATIQTLADKSVEKVKQKMITSITETISKRLGEELSFTEKSNMSNKLNAVISTEEFIGYVAVVLSALIRKMVKESEDKAKETEPDIDITGDKFSEAFQQANKMDWFSYLKE